MWLKIKVWTKATLFAAVLIYCAIFLYQNQTTVKFWYWFGHNEEHSLVLLLPATFLVGMISTVLISTTWRTYRQIRQMRDRSRTVRLEKEVADVRAKAAMVRTRPVPGTVSMMDPPAPSSRV